MKTPLPVFDMISGFYTGRPDPPVELDLSDPAARSVRLTWIPGNEHRSPVTREYKTGYRFNACIH